MAEAIDFDYYTTSRTNERYNKIKKDNELSLLHLNVRSLNANYRGLLMLISQFTFDFDIYVLSEICNYNIQTYENLLDGYSFYYDLPIHSNRGGVGIYIKNDIECTVRNDLKLKSDDEDDEELYAENLWLEISKNRKRYRRNLPTSWHKC